MKLAERYSAFIYIFLNTCFSYQLVIGQHIECLHCLPMAHTASTDRRWRGCYPVVVRCAGAGAAQPRLFTPGWCRHCTASRWSLHWSRHSSATHNTLPSHIIHPYRRKHCTADMHKIAVGAFYLGVIYSPSVTRTPHTHYCGQWSPRHRHCGTLDGGWWTPFGTGNTPSRDNLPTCQLNTHTTFQTLSDY